MSFLQTLYRNDTNIDFRPLWRRALMASGVLVVVTVALLLFRGLSLSIDFEGGGVWTVPVPDGVTVADGREASGLNDARVQLVEDPDGGNFIRVQAGAEAIENSAGVITGLAELGEVSPDEVSVSTVGPTWGDQITAKAVRALVLFFVAVALYLAWRMEWRMALGAVVAVVHDLAITAGAYALFGFEVSPATVIALLTILGYSLYDTVVVYDKVLENQNGPLGDRLGPSDLINVSMNKVLMRSLNTTISTILPVASLLVIGGVLLGGETLWDFALALFIGLLLGTYSSIFVAAPVLVWLKERDPELQAKGAPGRRAPASAGSGRGGSAAGSKVSLDKAGAEDGEPVAAGAKGRSQALAPEVVFEARPRKKRRR